jgi:hypothetical protein
MKVNMAHLRNQGIDFAVFEADVPSRMAAERANLLQQLVFTARRAGLKIDKAALAFRQGGASLSMAHLTLFDISRVRALPAGLIVLMFNIHNPIPEIINGQ